MAEPAKTNKWQRIAAIGAAATGGVAVIGLLAAGGGFVAGYFAKADIVERFQCKVDKQMELLDLRSAANNEYGNYVNTKMEIAKIAPVTTDDHVELGKLTALHEQQWAAAREYGAAAEDLAKRIREGICDPNRRGETK